MIPRDLTKRLKCLKIKQRNHKNQTKIVLGVDVIVHALVVLEQVVYVDLLAQLVGPQLHDASEVRFLDHGHLVEAWKLKGVSGTGVITPDKGDES
jgi:hypothetical protein